MAASEENRPLLVALHTWNGKYNQKMSYEYLEMAVKHDWNFIATNHRGPHNNHAAGASTLALTDISDAIRWARTRTHISKVAMVGVSGGGFTALNYLAWSDAEDVDVFVSSSAPTNLNKWRKETQGQKYADDITAMCGDKCRPRSPSHTLKKAYKPGARAYILHGLYDSLVPFAHAVQAHRAFVSGGGTAFLEVSDYGHEGSFVRVEEILQKELNNE
jgi:dipeptidyl aminopeptidase/acylaminoacyl peptidase